MENILKAAENFQVAPVEEAINESLFLEFMNKVAIWDYFGISKAHYLTLAESEKRDKITKYYLDMKSCNNTGKMYIFLFFIFFFILKMESKLSECLVLRDFLSDVNKDANEWILFHCYYCKNCSACAINSRLQKELKGNHFKIKNKHIKWWKIYFVDALPVLKPIG